MATSSDAMRRGLPRRSGGESWPPEGASPAGLVKDTAADSAVDVPADAVAANGAVAGGAVTAVAGSIAEAGDAAEAGAAVMTTPDASRVSRRGLPRVPGGDAWPSARETPTDTDSAARATVDSAAVSPDAAAPQADATTTMPAADAAAVPATLSTTPSSSMPAADPPPSAAGRPMRRGLPRVHGGERWPSATAVVAPQVQAPAAPDVSPSPAPDDARSAAKDEAYETAAPSHEAASAAPPEPAPAAPAPPEPAVAAVGAEPAAARVEPAPASADPAAAVRQGKPGKELSRPATFILGGIGLLALAVAAVLFTRWLVTLDFMQNFLVSYPGETPLPADVQPGFPAWVQWQHFFNTFLIVLIIRSGLQVRSEERPSGYWTPRWSKGGNGKISLNLWFHQALDVLWLLNGVVFVVLLFATSHWIRLVPTTWEVFPNALSAAIQYVSLDWPTENGWVNYNSLQMLMYFLTIFVAAPLAAISGARMSDIWPKNTKTLNHVYPVEWARAIHFPVMLYFVFFIIIHVALVFATGALRNLNHMYGGQDVVNWAGFWIFFVSLLLIVGAWIAARPLVLAPIAGLFGRVSSR